MQRNAMQCNAIQERRKERKTKIIQREFKYLNIYLDYLSNKKKNQELERLRNFASYHIFYLLLCMTITIIEQMLN